MSGRGLGLRSVYDRLRFKYGRKYGLFICSQPGHGTIIQCVIPKYGAVMRMRLKALLVDDEIHILSNLSKILPWQDMGFEIVGLARNGKDALEAADLHRPDLILSDIRMPVMDGITLLQKFAS
ncbi:hypothetical protein HMSSN036_09610 [Paenibacillus macerans]|nr:hypothetical protein HMSSN036_09610 [Paenibacillus macerans]